MPDEEDYPWTRKNYPIPSLDDINKAEWYPMPPSLDDKNKAEWDPRSMNDLPYDLQPGPNFKPPENPQQGPQQTGYDDVLETLRSSLRNAGYTYGMQSEQYKAIDKMIEQHFARQIAAEKKAQEEPSRMKPFREVWSRQDENKTEAIQNAESSSAGNGNDGGGGRVMNLAFRPKERK